MREGSLRAGILPALAGLSLVLLLAAAALAWLHTATPDLYGYDGWFHIRYAEVLRTEGPSRTFPWWDETFLKDRYADKEFLYHVLLIPFTFGDLVSGAKTAAILFGALAVGVFYLAGRGLGVPWPAAWSCALLASSTAFIYRLGFTRPSLAAVSLAVAGTAAILSGRRRWAFALAALYPHIHISWHLLPCVALLHDVVRARLQGERLSGRSLGTTGWTLAGAAAGAVITPYFPNNLYLWWVQNIRVLGLAWSAPADLGMGLEIRAGLSSQLLTYNAGVFAAMALAVYLLAARRGRLSPEAMTLLVISTGFLALSMMSRRFIEFWTPFTLLLAGVAARDFLAQGDRPPAAPGRRLAAAAGAAAVLGALFIHSTGEARRIISEDSGAVFAGAGRWMGSNIPAGEKIFHLDWDQFPQLFFFAPQFRYLVGLDPAFMYVTDPGRWRLWQQVTAGEREDLYGVIREEFGSRWVFALHDARRFVRLARRDPRFFSRYEDMNVIVFFLADGYRFLQEWEVTGWYPNPARRLFDGRLEGEPDFPGRSEGASREAAAAGPRAGSRRARFPDGFVDLDRALAVPPGVEAACGVAAASVVVAGRGPVTVGLATDDEFRLYVDGRQVASHSPLQSPPPGSPGGPAVSLDDILDLPAPTRERTIPLELEAGEHRIVIKICQVGDDLGFYLRAFDGEGKALAPGRGEARAGEGAPDGP